MSRVNLAGAPLNLPFPLEEIISQKAKELRSAKVNGMEGGRKRETSSLKKDTNVSLVSVTNADKVYRTRIQLRMRSLKKWNYSITWLAKLQVMDEVVRKL